MNVEVSCDFCSKTQTVSDLNISMKLPSCFVCSLLLCVTSSDQNL